MEGMKRFFPLLGIDRLFGVGIGGGAGIGLLCISTHGYLDSEIHTMVSYHDPI